MKFFLARGDQVRKKLAGFPVYYKIFFGFSKILVFCTANGNTIAGACGILSISNYVAIYVKEEYRRQGLGPLLFKKTIGTARNQGLGFILASASTYNVPILYFLRSFLGFREIVVLNKSNYVILLLPLNYRGELLYIILHSACSKLPESLVDYAIDFFMYVFDWIRKKIVGSM